MASFGRESLERTVALVDGVLRDPSPPRPDDLFGERTSLFRSDPPAPLQRGVRRLGLFARVDELFGEFSVFERSDRLPPDAELLTSAGREEGEPAFVAYRLGKGTVIRAGHAAVGARARGEQRSSVEVPRVTQRIWLVPCQARAEGAVSPSAILTRRVAQTAHRRRPSLALAAGGAVAYKVLSDEDPPEKRGSADRGVRSHRHARAAHRRRSAR